MCCSAFFFPRLDPVFDGGVRHKDSVVSPEVPGGGAIRQAILDHHPYRQANNAMGIVTSWRRQVRHVGVEILFALGAIVLRVTEVDVVGTTRDQITQIMQHAFHATIAVSAFAAVRTGMLTIVAASLNDLRLRQVLHSRDAFRGIRQVFSGSWHGDALLGKYIGAESLRHMPDFVTGSPVTMR